MCGIFGWALGAANRQSGETLSRITKLMAHRGPDGAGQSLFDTADGRFQIGLGHRRLSIIDIGGGQQPMSSEDGRFTVIFNGEIYNYLELREELLALGHRFRTSSDTEVLIEAYRAWGLDAISPVSRHVRLRAVGCGDTTAGAGARCFRQEAAVSRGPAWGVLVRLRDRAARSVPRL